MPMSDSNPVSPSPDLPPDKRRNWRRVARYALQLAVVLAIIAGVRLWQQRDIVSGPAPAHTGVLLDGRPVASTVQAGRPLLVHFWASWCPICSAEQGSIESLAKTYPTLTVAMQSGSDVEVASHMRKEALTFPVLNDPEGRVSAQWGVRAVPTSFIVDAQGRIRFVEVGYTTGIGLRLRLWWAGLDSFSR